MCGFPGVAVSAVCKDVQAQGGDGGTGAAGPAIQTPQVRKLLESVHIKF